MMVELLALALLPSKEQHPYDPPTQEQVIVSPFAAANDRKLYTAAAMVELERETKLNQELAIKKDSISNKIKAENKKIKDLKKKHAKIKAEKLAAKKRAAERASIARQTLTTQRETVQTVSSQKSRASVSGNAYAPGYCTWYVKNMRPDIGNFWGNANQWLGSAQASGYATGSQPRVGAIGVSYAGVYGHVVYVTGVSNDGSTVTFSEMNGAGGLGVITTRSDSSRAFQYIY